MPVTINIDNVPITFPFEPYDVQRNYMTKVIECLQNGYHGMLESPTGTGKTLSLLCSTLAWLTKKMDEDVSMNQPKAEKQLSADGDLVGIKNKEKPPQHPQIIYSSRTHSQLTQAISELRRSHYAYVNCAVLGSRDQLCIHSDVSQETNPGVKLAKCRALVKKKACLYQSNNEATKDDPVYHEEILDIEDLVKVGRKLTNCPYYMARELRGRADIVFMPYQYLLDMTTRKRMEINLENCVVILDEGHNVEKMCEESASFELSWSDLVTCTEELTEIINALPTILTYAVERPPFTEQELSHLRQVMEALQKSIDNIVLLNADNSSKFNGQYIFELLGKANINHHNFVIFDNLITKVTDWINENINIPLQHIGAGLDRFQNFLQIVFYLDKCSFEEHKKRVAESYKVYVTLESKNRFQPDRRLKKKDEKLVKRDAKVVHFWCFNPAFGMQALLKEGAHSIIITSGTLSPLQPLISELGIPMKVTLESGHVISKEQVYVGVIEAGPDKYTLNSSYKTRDDPKYVQSLGRTILNVSRLIPHGLLVFFPSYAVMEKCQNAWISSGVWDSMNNSKEICVEPRDKRELKEVMNRYYTKIAEPGSKGAIFMAVCRGKVSEGLDFVDHNGRGVIITGLPFPPCFDPRVEMKKQYLDENKKRVRGFEWYQLEATRAVNQAIGRVIRHRNDYGVILFCDIRFSSAMIRKSLSCWIRNQVKIHDSFPNLPRPLAIFFKRAQETLPQPEIKPLTAVASDESDDDDVTVVIAGSMNSPGQSPMKISFDSPTKSPYKKFGAYGSPSKSYSVYGSRYSAQPRYSKNLHQYDENYLNSKQTWWSKRSNYGRQFPVDGNHRAETISSPSFVGSAYGNTPVLSAIAYENIPTQPVTVNDNMATQPVTVNESMATQPVTDYENMPTQPVTAYENMATQPIGDDSIIEIFPETVQRAGVTRVLFDSSSSMNCRSDSASGPVTVKATTGIVSRPGNARGGRVYVPVNSAGPCDSGKCPKNVSSRLSDPTPYSRNTRGGITCAARGRYSTGQMVTFTRSSLPAAAGSAVAGTSNAGGMDVDMQGQPVNQIGTGESYMIEVGGSQMLAQNVAVTEPIGRGVVPSVLPDQSANRAVIADNQLATAVPNLPADSTEGEVQYYIVNADGTGTRALLVDNQYVLLDQKVEFVMGDPQPQVP